MILREEGWRAFYNGMGTNMVRAVPAAMTTMLTFETLKGSIGRMREEWILRVVVDGLETNSWGYAVSTSLGSFTTNIAIRDG